MTASEKLVQAIHAGKVVRGMTFSQKVWAATTRIPLGKVATYMQVARKVQSRSARAVGQALHRNPYAPVVPCHRVVAGNGALTGYAGGLAKKKRLLASEGVAVRGLYVDLKLHQVNEL